MLANHPRFWLILTGVVLALAATAVALYLTMRGPPPMAPADKFASVSGFKPNPESVTARVPDARSFTTAESAQDWQTSIRARIEPLFARNEAPALARLAIERAPLAAPRGLVRERLQLVGADGTRIPAVLQYPEGSKGRAAILVIPGHVPSGDSGLRQLVEDSDSYHHAAATTLAQRGFVTLAFELRGFGMLGMRANAEHNSVAHNALLQGTFYKAVVIDDARRALALLESLPQVDARRIGVAGASLGGELATTLAALDMRITAIAVSGYGGQAGPLSLMLIPDAINIHYCHMIPGTQSFLREEDMTLLLAPRPTLMLLGGLEYKADDGFVGSTASAWRALGAPDRFTLQIIPQRGHEFFVEETATFFTRTLGVR